MANRMRDHWWWRPGCRPGRKTYVWHILFDSFAEIGYMARRCQTRLNGIPGLDFVSETWLHMTMHVAGFTDEIENSAMNDMVTEVAERLSKFTPIQLTFGETLFDPEGIMLPARPTEPVIAVRDAILSSCEALDNGGGTSLENRPPHITVAYCNADLPMQPAVDAVGSSVGVCNVTISSIHLVSQERLGHSYRWERVTEVRLGHSINPQSR